jgi:CubicO group peptidase (beta-lactamase class C family)
MNVDASATLHAMAPAESVTIVRTPVPTAEQLGLMRGTPPPADRLVTLENWMFPPHNRWALQHVGELVPTAPVRRGDRTWDLPEKPDDLGSVAFDVAGEAWTMAEVLDAIACDGIAVLHGGSVVWERYANSMDARTLHVCFSVSKSVTATLAGILIGRGDLDPDALVTSLIPEADGSGWTGATVRHVLDMRAGIRWNEIYDDRDGDVASYRHAIGWWPRTRVDAPTDEYSLVASLEADRAHGGAFRYQTPLTAMLGWICERAGGDRLPALLSRELWAPLGAEHDAAIAVDPHGNPVAGSGFCATLRDLARFGQLWLLGGRTSDGRQLVPEAWIRDTVTGGVDSRAAYEAQEDGDDPDWPQGFYRNKWWVLDPSRPLYSALGIHGQYVTIDVPSGVVIAMFSSHPVADSEAAFRVTMRAFRAVVDALGG